MSDNNNIFFFWHCRQGKRCSKVVLFGSWNEFKTGIPLKFNGTSMYGGHVTDLPANTYYYYFEIDGERTVDHTKQVITGNSEELNIIQVPLDSQQEESLRLFEELMRENLEQFSGTKRSVNDLATFDEEAEKLFREWDEASGPMKNQIKGKLRLKFLNEIGCLPNMSLEENIVEFRRNIAVLRIRLRQNELNSEKRIQNVTDEKLKAHNIVEDIWKKEREKWRDILAAVRNENESLKNGLGFSNAEESVAALKEIDVICGGNNNTSNNNDDKDAIINSLKKKIQSLQSENINSNSNNNISINASAEHTKFQKMIEDLEKQQSEIQSKYKEAMEKIEHNDTEMINIKNKYKEALQLKRKYFNQVQELKGNIRVYARSRPILPIDGSSESIVSFLTNETMQVKDGRSDKLHLFTFDHVFNTKTSQEQVYNEVSPLIESVMDGYNCCIFAYGQTGSGKTFTMQGNDANPGVNIRALQQLFTLKEMRYPDFIYDIKVSMIEIYNEKIKDLLVKSSVSKDTPYKVRQTKTKEIYVENLSSHSVNTEQDVFKLMQFGKTNRSVARTKSNEESSRSHMVLTISVVGKGVGTDISYYGKLHLIDLAGSERVKKSGVEGNAMKEAQNINKSLASLGDVIQALSEKSKHIPFRNSTLTHLLTDSLGGHAKTLMFVNLSPAETHFGETYNALKFAQRAKKVELGPAQKRMKLQIKDTFNEQKQQKIVAKEKLESTNKSIEKKSRSIKRTYKGTDFIRRNRRLGSVSATSKAQRGTKSRN